MKYFLSLTPMGCQGGETQFFPLTASANLFRTTRSNKEARPDVFFSGNCCENFFQLIFFIWVAKSTSSYFLQVSAVSNGRKSVMDNSGNAMKP
jgi:hypothetical protein